MYEAMKCDTVRIEVAIDISASFLYLAMGKGWLRSTGRFGRAQERKQP
jgi:hypothetical protein